MPPRDSWQGTFVVATALCIVCSLLVSTAAVSLKSTQDRNKEIDKKKNVLLSAGLCEPGATSAEVDQIFAERIREELIDLDTGEVVTEERLAELGVDAKTYDARKAAKDPGMQEPISPDGALPSIPYREPLARVYQIVDGEENQGYIFPVYAKGLWSTLYGFVAIDADCQTVKGITFYEHKETPGLGGEVDNANWKATWPGKQVYDESGGVKLTVLKGKAGGDKYAVDGLSGATITTKGVNNLVKYWLGPTAYGQYLEKRS